MELVQVVLLAPGAVRLAELLAYGLHLLPQQVLALRLGQPPLHALRDVRGDVQLAQVRLHQGQRPAHALLRARRGQELQPGVEGVLERGDEEVREPVRRGGLEHRLEPPRVALATLEPVHQLPRAIFKRSGDGGELRIVLLRVPSASSRRVELSNLADHEGVHGGELVEAKPAASLEEEGVGPDGGVLARDLDDASGGAHVVETRALVLVIAARVMRRVFVVVGVVDHPVGGGERVGVGARVPPRRHHAHVERVVVATPGGRGRQDGVDERHGPRGGEQELHGGGRKQDAVLEGQDGERGGQRLVRDVLGAAHGVSIRPARISPARESSGWFGMCTRVFGTSRDGSRCRALRWRGV